MSWGGFEEMKSAVACGVGDGVVCMYSVLVRTTYKYAKRSSPSVYE